MSLRKSRNGTSNAVLSLKRMKLNNVNNIRRPKSLCQSPMFPLSLLLPPPLFPPSPRIGNRLLMTHPPLSSSSYIYHGQRHTPYSGSVTNTNTIAAATNTPSNHSRPSHYCPRPQRCEEFDLPLPTPPRTTPLIPLHLSGSTSPNNSIHSTNQGHLPSSISTLSLGEIQTPFQLPPISTYIGSNSRRYSTSSIPIPVNDTSRSSSSSFSGEFPTDDKDQQTEIPIIPTTTTTSNSPKKSSPSSSPPRNSINFLLC